MAQKGKHVKTSSSYSIKKFILFIFEVTSIVVIVRSSTEIYLWHEDNKKNENLLNKISSNINIDESKDNKDINKYDIDFEALKKTNEDTIAWLKVEGTQIEYPVVKTTNNDFYLNHDLDKSKNSAGWIFMDYTNKLNGTDKNIVIYGHNRRDGSMFGTLKNILNKEWYENENNKYITFINENQKSKYEIFSIYEIEREDYYIKTDFNDDFEEFITKIKSRSIKNFSTEVTSEDEILTLSTCADNNQYRVVLHAKKLNNIF